MRPTRQPVLAGTLAGLRVITSERLTIDTLHPRSWWERWFTRPWRPWLRATVVRTPMDTVSLCADDCGRYLLMHPQKYEQIKRWDAELDAAQVGR